MNARQLIQDLEQSGITLIPKGQTLMTRCYKPLTIGQRATICRFKFEILKALNYHLTPYNFTTKTGCGVYLTRSSSLDEAEGELIKKFGVDFINVSKLGRKRFG